MINQVTTKWMGNMAFESNNPSGHDLIMDAGAEDGGEGKGFRPKALMLSSLAGCWFGCGLPYKKNEIRGR